jgi:hypothetical protein
MQIGRPVMFPPPSEVLTIAYSSYRTEVSDEQVIDMVLRASRKNYRMGITGALWFGETRFFQVLEGEPDILRHLYAQIAADERHTDVHIVVETLLPKRRFAAWGMYVFEGEEEIAIRRLHTRITTSNYLSNELVDVSCLQNGFRPFG